MSSKGHTTYEMKSGSTVTGFTVEEDGLIYANSDFRRRGDVAGIDPVDWICLNSIRITFDNDFDAFIMKKIFNGNCKIITLNLNPFAPNWPHDCWWWFPTDVLRSISINISVILTLDWILFYFIKWPQGGVCFAINRFFKLTSTNVNAVIIYWRYIVSVIQLKFKSRNHPYQSIWQITVNWKSINWRDALKVMLMGN